MELNLSGSSTFLTKETFLGGNFDPDAFIAEQRKVMPLESLRNELSMFLKVINASVVELINRDYADFLNLSSHLLSVENLLSGIQQPTEQLRLQIIELRELLSSSINEFNELLSRKVAIQQQRRNCERLRELIEIQKKITEIHRQTAFRDVNQFNRIVSLLQKALVLHESTKSNLMSKQIGEKIRVFASQFDTELDSTFRSSLVALNSVGVSQNVADLPGEHLTAVLACLHCYGALSGGEKRAESIFREAFVSRVFREFVNESFIEQHGLQAIYSRTLEFCSTTLAALQQGLIEREAGLLSPFSATAKLKHDTLPFRSSTQQFDFASYAFAEFVAEVDAPRGGVSSVFGIADPDAFHRSFTASLNFLDQLETCLVEQSFATSDRIALAQPKAKRAGSSACENEADKMETAFSTVLRFRQSPAYVAFMSKWNLFVYFELRFQTLASRLEQSLANVHEPVPSKLEQQSKSHSGFRPSLVATKTLIELINLSWSDSVYLDVLASKFWKLTLQLSSRYVVAMRKEVDSLNLSSGHTPFGSGLADNSVVMRAIRFLNDLPQLGGSELRNIYRGVIQPRLVAACSYSASAAVNESLNETALEEAIGEYCESLQSCATGLRKNLVDYVVACGCLLLKQTSEIPRLFRKTNRAAPTRASAHISDTLDMLVRLNEATQSTLVDGSFGHDFLADIANELCAQFATIAADLLESVRKMEDTLKRLKRSRTTQTSLQNAALQNELSDDDKIRMQLSLDMSTFVQKLEKELGLRVASLSEVHRLSTLTDHLQQQLRQNTE